MWTPGAFHFFHYLILGNTETTNRTDMQGPLLLKDPLLGRNQGGGACVKHSHKQKEMQKHAGTHHEVAANHNA